MEMALVILQICCPAPVIPTILIVAQPSRLADSALRARRPREKGFQKEQVLGDDLRNSSIRCQESTGELLTAPHFYESAPTRSTSPIENLLLP